MRIVSCYYRAFKEESGRTREEDRRRDAIYEKSDHKVDDPTDYRTDSDRYGWHR